MKNTFLMEKQKILDTNPRSQSSEKGIMLGIYNGIAKLLSPLFELDNEQPRVQKQESEEDTHIEYPDTTAISALESEESAAQRRYLQEKGLKTLTSNQILSRLPISLARLNSGNDSEKLENEIRQLLYSL